MLKKFGLAAVAAMVIGAGSAEAGLVTLTNIGDSATLLYDGTNLACAACKASVAVTLLSTTSLKFEFANTSTDVVLGQNMLTAFGFNFTPNVDFTGATAVFSGVNWSIGNGGMGNLEFQSSSNNGINNALDAGASGSVVVTLGPMYNLGGNKGWFTPVIGVPLEIDGTAVHFQALRDGSSIKPVGSCCGIPDVSVPDGGMSLSLLGVALAGIGILRRRLR